MSIELYAGDAKPKTVAAVNALPVDAPSFDAEMIKVINRATDIASKPTDVIVTTGRRHGYALIITIGLYGALMAAAP